jgi:hypothetical protein
MNMKTVYSLTAFAVCALGANAFAAPFQSPNGYRISPPPRFVLRPNTNFSFNSDKLRVNNMGYDAFFMGPHSETLTVTIVKAPPQLTLPLVLQYLPQQLERAMSSSNSSFSSNATPSFKQKTKLRVLSKGYTTLGGTKAVTFTSRLEVGAPAKVVTIRQVAVIRGGRMFTFSCTAPASTFASLSPALNRSFASVRWTK